METCGKELADEAEREALKESGIGTPATRAGIIETLFSGISDVRKILFYQQGMVVFLAVKIRKLRMLQ